jgi:hypothetical protein
LNFLLLTSDATLLKVITVALARRLQGFNYAQMLQVPSNSQLAAVSMASSLTVTMSLEVPMCSPRCAAVAPASNRWSSPS